MSRARRIVLFCIPVIIIALIFGYISNTYHFVPSRVQSLKIIFDRSVQQHDFVVYVSDSTDVIPNLGNPFYPRLASDSILMVEFGKGVKLRQFRLYFQRQIEDGAVREISLVGNDTESRINLSKVEGDLIEEVRSGSGEDLLAFHVSSGNGYAYLETPRFFYPHDCGFLLVSIILAVGLGYVFYFFVVSVNQVISLASITIAEWSVIAFIFSIWLPQVFFNVTLGISVLLVLRSFKFNQFLLTRLNIFYTALFLVYLLNFLYFSSIENFSHFEKYLSLILVPIYASCIRKKRLLIFFCVSALLIGATVLGGALVNLAIFRNFEVISSNNLTGIIHPVYYSYLLAFSIIYIELGTNLERKRLISLTLFILLLLSGSKLVIFSMMFLSLFIFRASVKVVVVPLLLMALLVFSPVRNNFGLVADVKDLSVLTETHINDPTDERLNGFTLRVLLWEESIRVERLGQLIFGNGIGPEGNAVMEGNLRERGLMNHLWYNAHNQYLTTFFHTGFLGLVTLMSIVISSIWSGYKSKDKVMLLFSIVTAMAMMSESVFERVSGTVFFSLILLIIANSKSQLDSKLDLANSTKMEGSHDQIPRIP